MNAPAFAPLNAPPVHWLRSVPWVRRSVCLSVGLLTPFHVLFRSISGDLYGYSTFEVGAEKEVDVPIEKPLDDDSSDESESGAAVSESESLSRFAVPMLAIAAM